MRLHDPPPTRTKHYEEVAITVVKISMQACDQDRTAHTSCTIAVKDLTQGSIVNHILSMALPLAVGMFAQIAYHLIDLYFVSKVGVAATAGVNAAGNIGFIIAALTQIVSVGTAALIAHAVGRKDQDDANVVFNQALALSLICGAITTTLISFFIRHYLQAVSADAETVDAGVAFVLFMLPSYALSLPMAVVTSALRGTGVVRPTIVIYIITLIFNTILAPILIMGWGTGVPMGVRGAGLATSISVALGLIIIGGCFHRFQQYLELQRDLVGMRLKVWSRIFMIGWPTGGDLALFFVYTAVVYYAIRDFGVSAQAGFGIGSRVLHAILMPGMSIAIVAGPIAGQNFGAGNIERVLETFIKAALAASLIMISIICLVQWRPMAFLVLFAVDPSTIQVAAAFLQITSWSLIAQGLVSTCSSMFQGFGNTIPSLIGSCTRLAAFTVPVLWLSSQPGFRIEQVWYLSAMSLVLQAIMSLWLLRVEFKKRIRSRAALAGVGDALP
jgi:putative MATE family efflux protein